MGFKDYIKSPRNWILLVLIVCAVIFKIKALRYLVLFILVTSTILGLVGKHIKGIKNKADAKIAAQNIAVDAANNFIDYSNVGHIYGSELFCKYYPKYILVLNLLILGVLVACLYYGQYLQAAFLFFVMNIFIILNQIWRQMVKLSKVKK